MHQCACACNYRCFPWLYLPCYWIHANERFARFTSLTLGAPITNVYKKKHEDRFSFSFNYVKQDEVRKKMSQFNVKKSTGYDHIPGKILSLAHKASANPFAFLMNACTENSKFSSEIKYAELNPLFKKTDNLLKEVYRPVSILTAIYQRYTKIWWTIKLYMRISKTYSRNYWVLYKRNIAPSPYLPNS